MRYLILCKLQKLKTHKNPLKHAVYGQIKKCLFTIITYILYNYLKYCFKRGKNQYEQKTQQQIANQLGISRSYVYRIETKIQKKLNKYIRYTE